MKTKTAIKYPTWKVRGEPTPNETLYICDECGTAVWGTDTGNALTIVCHGCTGRKGGFKRMRRATAAETAEAKTKLETII